MSFYSAGTIRRLCKEGVMVRLESGRIIRKPLIEPVTKQRLAFIEGSAFDLTLANVYGADADRPAPLIGVMIRDGAETGPIPFEDNEMVWFLQKGRSYLIESREAVNVPLNVTTLLDTRSSLFRGFARLTFGAAHPNFQGRITGLLTVHHPNGLWIQQYSRFAFVRFATFDTDETDAYDGMYGTGKNRITVAPGTRGY